MAGQKIENGRFSVILIEDDQLITETLVDGLGELGCHVTACADAKEGLRTITRAGEDDLNPFDLVVLDLGLPDQDGIELLQAIREMSDIPIIILTGRDSEAERIVALELGCDDFIAKPCSPREIWAHMKAIMRRIKTKTERMAPNTDPQIIEGLPQKTMFHFGEWVFDPELHHLSKSDGTAKRLSPLSSVILHTLIHAAGRVLSREFILDAASGREADVFDRSIDLHILRLRRIIEENPSDPQFIQTIRGAGYCFKKDVIRAEIEGT